MLRARTVSLLVWAIAFACASAESALRAQFRLEAEPSSPALERALELRERDGATLRAVGDRVLRTREGVETELGCTLEGGTGRIFEIVTQKHGASFLAAERGVFTIAPEVEELDPIHRLDGGPQDAPTGIALAPDETTLWVTSARGLGCIDLVQFYGTSIDAKALPQGTIEDVDVNARGEVRVSIDGRVLRMQLPAAPVLRVQRVEGEAWKEGERRRLASNRLRIEAEAKSVAPCTLRFRWRGRHLWRPFPADGWIPRVEPGAQSYDIVALDGAMQRSEIVRVDVEVPYPKAFEKRTLLAIALGFLALLCALFAWLAKSGRLAAATPAARWTKAALSVFAAFVVCVQIATGIEPHARSWPFVGFTMYTQKFRARSSIFETKFVGLHRDGSRSELNPLLAGRHMDGEWMAALPLVYDPAREAPRFVDDYNRATGLQGARELVGVQIVEHRKRLTRRAPIDVAPILWVHWSRP